jgi:hypothetical protein
MTPELMRIEIAKVYHNSPRIKNKLQAMPDNQVIAFYRRLQNEGKIK